VHANAYGWEGDMATYDEKSPRIRGNSFVFDDTAINCWGQAEGKPTPYVDGVKLSSRRSLPRRDLRNSFFRHGRCRLGDRHILEIAGENAKLTAVDAKVCPHRRHLGVDNPAWRLGDAAVADFASEWGAPYGSKQVVLQPGASAEIEVIGTDVSVAYVDAPQGGALKVSIDGVERLAQPTNAPFVDIAKREHFMENRRGILGLGFGEHTVRVEAADGPVALLGVFVYDSRSNRANERRLIGRASPGETVAFSASFRARPVVICHGGLAAQPADVSAREVAFSGESRGTYEVVGE